MARSPSPRRSRRRTLDDLISNTPGDGIITGIGTVNARAVRRGTRALRGARLRLHRARGHAGRDEPSQEGPAAQGRRGMEAARRACSPKAAAGGRATRISPASRASIRRPSANTRSSAARCRASASIRAAVSRAMPPCSAASDVVIATANSNIGMGGPGDDRRRRPWRLHARRGRPDVGAGAQRRRRHRRRGRSAKRSRRRRNISPTSRARVAEWNAADQKTLRHLIPENRLRVYDIRKVIASARRHRLGARTAARISRPA